MAKVGSILEQKESERPSQMVQWVPRVKAGFAIHIPKLGLPEGRWLPDRLSVFSAEVVVMVWTLSWAGVYGSGLISSLNCAWRFTEVVWCSCGFQHIWWSKGMRVDKAA